MLCTLDLADLAIVDSVGSMILTSVTLDSVILDSDLIKLVTRDLFFKYIVNQKVEPSPMRLSSQSEI